MGADRISMAMKRSATYSAKYRTVFTMLGMAACARALVVSPLALAREGFERQALETDAFGRMSCGT
jgi:hypothetical protein